MKREEGEEDEDEEEEAVETEGATQLAACGNRQTKWFDDHAEKYLALDVTWEFFLVFMNYTDMILI